MKRLQKILAGVLALAMGCMGGVAFASESSEDYFATERDFERVFEDDQLEERNFMGADRVWTIGESHYILTDGSELLHLDADGTTRGYTLAGYADSIYLSPELVYYMSGNTVYRLYLPTGEQEAVYHSEILTDIRPLTNQTIGVGEINPIILRYWEETGDYDGEVGVNESVDYLYDIRTGSKTDYIRYRGEPNPPSRATVSSVDYGDYGPGDYFTKTGNSCSSTKNCHNYGYCTWVTSSDNYKNKCNCLAHGGAIQCMGYARYVYEQNHGTTDWGTGEAVSLSSSNGADQLRKALENTQPGAHIRLDKKYSVIFTGTTSNGFTVYECNRSGRNCEVQSSTYTYSGTASSYDNATIYE